MCWGKMVWTKELDNDAKIIRTADLDYTPDPRGIGYVFFTSMSKNKDKIAQIDGLTGEKDTFGALRQRCIRTAITMRSNGVKSDDIVSICSFNHLNSCVPFISGLFLGSKIASLDPTLSLKDSTYLLKQVTPKIIFVAPEAVDMIEKVVKEVSANIQIVVFGSTNNHIPFSDFLQPCDGENDFVPTQVKSLQDTALIFFSSGTSGMPKGVCCSQLGFLNQLISTIDFDLCTDVILSFASLYWITSALFCGVTMINGSTRLVLPRFDASLIWEKVHTYKPTFMFLAPSQILDMCSQERSESVDSTSLKDIFVGGAPMLGEQILELRADFPNTRVQLSYGMTEVSGFLSCFKPGNPKDMKLIAQKPSSSGRGVKGISYKVVNPDTGEVLGPNQRGELRIKTKVQLNGYYKMDSSDVWDSDGWVKTGDIVYYDEDHCFYVVDRIKEMLKYQSWHIPPALLENVILSHPSIKSAVVIGLPHKIDGDHPMAVVVLDSDSENVTPEEIRKYVDEKVHERQKLRGGVIIVDQLPTTPTGKIMRKEVKRLYSRTLI